VEAGIIVSHIVKAIACYESHSWRFVLRRFVTDEVKVEGQGQIKQGVPAVNSESNPDPHETPKQNHACEQIERLISEII
jgi:hypothetical protein